MQRSGAVSTLATTRKDVLIAQLEYLEYIKEEALQATKNRWRVYPKQVKNREPFGYKKFQATANQIQHYNQMVLSKGPTWIGH